MEITNMKKATSLLTGVAMSVLLTACGEDKVKLEFAECYFPDAPSAPAPAWVCDAPVEGIDVSAVGSAERSKAGHNFTKTHAVGNARVELASRMKVQVQNMIKNYVETTGAGETETVDKVLTSVTKQITNETLVGTRPLKSLPSPNGTLYVLVGMDPGSVEAAAKAALKTSMKNERALWQQFKAKKGQDELAAEISKMDGSN